MKRELIFTFCCLLTTLVWSQEYQRTETGIKASIFGKKIDVEVQWFNANSLRVLKMPHGQSVDKKSRKRKEAEEQRRLLQDLKKRFLKFLRRKMAIL